MDKVKRHKVGSLELDCEISLKGVNLTVRVPIVGLADMKPNAGDKLVSAAKNVWEVENAYMGKHEGKDYLTFTMEPDSSDATVEKALNRVFNQVAREQKLGRRAFRQKRREQKVERRRQRQMIPVRQQIQGRAA